MIKWSRQKIAMISSRWWSGSSSWLCVLYREKNQYLIHNVNNRWLVLNRRKCILRYILIIIYLFLFLLIYTVNTMGFTGLWSRPLLPSLPHHNTPLRENGAAVPLWRVGIMSVICVFVACLRLTVTLRTPLGINRQSIRPQLSKIK